VKTFSHRIFLWDASIDFAYACKTLLINLTTMKSALTNSIRFVLFISIAALISSCSSSSNVADGGILQKRKYRKGVHLNILKKHKVQEQSIPDEVIAQNSKNEPDREAIDNAEVDKSAHSISAQHAPIEALEAHSAQNKTTTLNAFRRVFNRKKTTSTAADSPEKIERQNTLTSQYQKGGKTALLFAWIFAILPLLAWAFGVLGLPMLQVTALFFALLFLILALVFALRNRVYSAHARKALWLILLAIVFWAAAASVATLVLGVALL